MAHGTELLARASGLMALASGVVPPTDVDQAAVRANALGQRAEQSAVPVVETHQPCLLARLAARDVRCLVELRAAN